MLRFACFAAVLVAALAVPITDLRLDDEWNIFQNMYKKEYNLEGEAMMRRQIWESNVRLIQKHNLEFDRGVHTYTLGMNEYGDMTSEEFVQTMNGYMMRNTTSGASLFLPPSNVAVPDTVDWRPKGYVTPVKNQGQCGSCWAFSTTGSLEGQTFKKTGKLVSLSEQNLVDCSSREGNHGCKGGLMDQGFKYIKINNGIDTESSYPYTARTGFFCKFKKSDVGATDTGYTDVKSKSETDLQSAVATVGPISVAMDAGHSSFQLYKTGIYTEKKCSSTQLDHGVLAVGYGTDDGKDYWLVKNSWGTKWGMEGYFKIARNAGNMCGLATQASYPTV